MSITGIFPRVEPGVPTSQIYHFPNNGESYTGDETTGVSMSLNDGEYQTTSNSGEGHGTNNYAICVLPTFRVIDSIKYVPDNENPQRSANLKFEISTSKGA